MTTSGVGARPSACETLSHFCLALENKRDEERLRSRLQSLCAWTHEARRDTSQRSAEFRRALWKLRRLLWQRANDGADADMSTQALLGCALWDVQLLCYGCGVFESAAEWLSAQYNVVERWVRIRAMPEASAHVWTLYRWLMKAASPSATDAPAARPEVIPFPCSAPETGQDPSDKMIRAGMAIFVAVLTCGSQGERLDRESEWMATCSCAAQSLDLWLTKVVCCDEYRSHMTSAVYHCERIMEACGRAVQSAHGLDDVTSLLCAFVRICGKSNKSAAAGIRAYVSELPTECFAAASWKSFEKLVSEEATKQNGILLMNGVFKRCLKSKNGRRDARFVLKQLMEMKEDSLRSLPDWIAIHLATSIAVSVNAGSVVHLSREHVERIHSCVQQFVPDSVTRHEEMLAVLDALSLLSCALKMDETTLMLWQNCEQYSQWTASVLKPFTRLVLLANETGMLRSLPKQKTRLLLSQSITASIKLKLLCLKGKSGTVEDDSILRRAVQVLFDAMDESDVVSGDSGLSCLPQEVRAVIDSALRCGTLLDSKNCTAAAVEIYAMLCEMLSELQKSHSKRLGIPAGCLSSVIMDCTMRFCKKAEAEKKLSDALHLLRVAIAHGADAFKGQPAADFRRLVNLYCRFSLQIMKQDHSVAYTSLVDQVAQTAPQLEAEGLGVMVCLARSEVLGLMKYLDSLDMQRTHGHRFKGRCRFPSDSYADLGQESIFSSWLQVLSFVFEAYIGTMDRQQTLRCLRDCLDAAQHRPLQRRVEKHRHELLVLCHALVFLFDALDFSVRSESRSGGDASFADPADVNAAICLWNEILLSGEDVLDPEFQAMVLLQCTDVAHARCWTKEERALSQILDGICARFDRQLSAETKARCRQPLPIPFAKLLPHESVVLPAEDLTDSDCGGSIEDFQRRVSVQLNQALFHVRDGSVARARAIISDARRYAMGLYQSFAERHPSADRVEFRQGNAWLAHGLYACCLLLLAETAVAFEDLGEAKYLLEEMLSVVGALRSRILSCLMHTLTARLMLLSQDPSSAESHLEIAEGLAPASTAALCAANAGDEFQIRLRLAVCSLGGRLSHAKGETRDALQRLEAGLTILRDLNRRSWSLEVHRLWLQCQSRAVRGQLSPLESLGLITDYTVLASKCHLPRADLAQFLLFCTGWHDDLLSELSDDVLLFGSVPLADQFRSSLDLGSTTKHQVQELQEKLESVNDSQPEICHIKAILHFALEAELVGRELMQIKVLLLLHAWNRCLQVSTLLRQVSVYLGCLLAHLGHHYAAAFFLTCCQGNGIRLQTIHNIPKKATEISSTERARNALSIVPFDILPVESQFWVNLDKQCQSRLDRIFAHGNPCSCMVSLCSGSNGVVQLSRIAERLLFVRCAAGRPPIIAVLPKQMIALPDNNRIVVADASAFDSDLKQMTFSDVLCSLSTILDENRSSFQKDTALENDESQRLEMWWKGRVQLDRKLGFLIKAVETALGPWKLLFLNLPLQEPLIRLTQTFLQTVLGRPWIPVGSDFNNDPRSQIIAIFLAGLKLLSQKDLGHVAGIICEWSPCSCNRKTVEAQLRFLRDMKQNESSTPCRISVSVTRRSSRIHRMRSSCKVQAIDELSFMSPVPQSRAFRDLERPSMPTAVKAIDCQTDSFMTPEKQSSWMDPRLGEIGLELSKIWEASEQRSMDPVVLILDFRAQQFPWESLAAFRGQGFYRLPCVQLGPYLSFLNGHARSDGAAVRDLHSTFYVLDPEGDLQDSCLTFQEWFGSISMWTRILPCQSESDLVSCKLLPCLQKKDAFLYFGHNCGERMLHPRELRKHAIRSAALLVGCSSGRLKSSGEGSILEYLAAGSVCCVGNLWAVSDAEINRFSKKLIETWMQGGEAGDLSGQVSRNQTWCAAAVVDMAASVSTSRSACRLQWLIGAAPVAYGIPAKMLYQETAQRGID